MPVASSNVAAKVYVLLRSFVRMTAMSNGETAKISARAQRLQINEPTDVRTNSLR